MSLGLVGRASCGWHCVTAIDGGTRRLGGAVSLGLLGRASCWWRCAVAALVRGVEVLVRVGGASTGTRGASTSSSRGSTGGSLAGQNG